MVLQDKIDRAFKRLRENKEKRDENETENVPLETNMEKGDFKAMVLAAFMVILPICIGALLVLAVVGVLFLLH